MKALKLLREQKKENLKNRPLYCSLKDFHKYNLEKICIFNDAIEELEDFIKESEIRRVEKESENKEKGVKKMTEKETIDMLSEKIPKGSPDFERLYRVYGDFRSSKSYAIHYFENNWEHMDIEALEVVTKMYLNDLKPDDYKPSFNSFLDTDLLEYIMVKQKELEQGVKGKSFFCTRADLEL